MARYLYIYSFLLFILMGCDSHERRISAKLDSVDSIIEEYPDSALCLLDSIDESQLKTRELKARYALLKSMALDKNYIDTTTFDVLQPAIDFYSKHGSPNEKLRTYYYQGRIYQNASNDEQALKSFIKAEELTSKASDSLTIARLYVAESALYQKQYLYESMVNSVIKAAEIYKKNDNKEFELELLGNAINGYLSLENRYKADSLFLIVDSLCVEMDTLLPDILHAKIIYALENLDSINTKAIMDKVAEYKENEILQLDLVYGYIILGDEEKAETYWEEIKDHVKSNQLKYLSIGALIMEKKNNYKEALDYMKCYQELSDSIYSDIMTDNVISTRIKYELEKEALIHKGRKNQIVMYGLVTLFFALFIIGFVYIRMKGLKIKSLRLENEKYKLKEEKRISEHIREEQSYEIESMKKELGVLESEKERITEILSVERKMADSIRIAMKKRLVVLNGLIAAKISSNDKYSIAYKELEHTVENDKSTFLKSIQSTLEETNPQFMNLLNEKGLTEMEIKCVCLLALGLKASEIGRYLGTARHYNLSSSIRKKLGLDPNEMNIGKYIQSKII